MEYAATNGMLSTLDPHSLLLDPQTYTDMKLATSGHFGGPRDRDWDPQGFSTVIRSMKDTPAWQAGCGAAITSCASRRNRPPTWR